MILYPYVAEFIEKAINEKKCILCSGLNLDI
jgi:hypothetical protein